MTNERTMSPRRKLQNRRLVGKKMMRHSDSKNRKVFFLGADMLPCCLLYCAIADHFSWGMIRIYLNKLTKACYVFPLCSAVDVLFVHGEKCDIFFKFSSSRPFYECHRYREFSPFM